MSYIDVVRWDKFFLLSKGKTSGLDFLLSYYKDTGSSRLAGRKIGHFSLALSGDIAAKARIDSWGLFPLLLLLLWKSRKPIRLILFSGYFL